ncbi:MAG: RNA polymerase sigma-70 factor (ECF subfamily) [Phycisphaerales bacterium]|jgi:RNA polymerase sigma-70 factor (ECF subfamily)
MGMALTTEIMHEAKNPDADGIVERASAGEEAAWVELVEMYGRRVFALAKSRIRRADLAEEIAQSVFATVAIKLRDGGYTDHGRFEAWLFRIAMNRIRDEIRRERRHAVPTDPAKFGGLGGNDPAKDRDGDSGERAGELGLLRRAMGELGDTDREVIELRHHGELSFKQMAEMLDEPMGTLLARHHRALRKLKGIMDELAGGRPEAAG